MNRLSVMRVIAWIMAVSALGFGLFTIVFGIISPAQEIHAIHNVVVATLLIVLSAPPALVVARAPDRSIRALVILGVVSIASLATMALSLTLDPFTLPFALWVGVLWVLVPSREGATPDGRPSWIMLGAVAVAAVPLVIYALGQAELQRTDSSSEHAAFFHWVETSFYAIAILMLGLLAALRPGAFRTAGWMAGMALALLGAASLLLGSYASAIEAPWSWAALVGGLVFVAMGEWEARRRGFASQRQ
jgi:MFS family permease